MRVILCHFKTGARHEIYSGEAQGCIATVSMPKENFLDVPPKELEINVEWAEKPITTKIQ